MPTIKITDDRQGATFRTGVNGRQFDLPINTEIEVSDAMAEHLHDVGCRFDEVETSRASSAKEGSGVGLARPIGAHDVSFPGTMAKSADDSFRTGDQPGDVTTLSAGVRTTEGEVHGDFIEDDAKVSDIRVATERVTKADAPVAAKAGEGEGGTEKVEAPKTKLNTDAKKRTAKK